MKIKKNDLWPLLFGIWWITFPVSLWIATEHAKYTGWFLFFAPLCASQVARFLWPDEEKPKTPAYIRRAVDSGMFDPPKTKWEYSFDFVKYYEFDFNNERLSVPKQHPLEKHLTKMEKEGWVLVDIHDLARYHGSAVLMRRRI